MTINVGAVTREAKWNGSTSGDVSAAANPRPEWRVDRHIGIWILPVDLRRVVAELIARLIVCLDAEGCSRVRDLRSGREWPYCHHHLTISA